MLKKSDFVSVNLEDDIKINTEYFNQFKNLSVYSIGKIIGVNPFLMGPHLGTATLVKEMYAYTGLKDLAKKFNKNNISIKTIRLQENGIPKESMSFERIDFLKVVEEKWEDSFIKGKFRNTTFLFVVFQLQNGVLYYRDMKLWKMSDIILESQVKSFWTHLRNRLLEGVTLTPIQQKGKTIIENNLPSTMDNEVMHTRPKASDGNDKDPLPDGQSITKQSYWFNASFVGEIVSDLQPLKVKNSLENSVPQLSSRELELIKSAIQDPIYTLEEFYGLVKGLLPQFNLFQITDIFLKEIGLKIHPPYVFSEKFKKLKDYFDETVLSRDYFELSDEAIFQTDYFKRYLKNLEKALSIVKIDDCSYITKGKMESAGLKKQNLESYQLAVLNTTKNQGYFTYNSLRKDGFSHEIQEYGFDSIFYESLIIQVPYLKSIRLFGTIFFKKSNRKLKSEQFFTYILEQEKQSSLKLSQLCDVIEELFSEAVTYDSLETVLLKYDKKPYYSRDLERIFIDKSHYLDYLHK